MQSPEAAVREAFRLQAEWCAQLGSPFTARLCAVLEQTLDLTTITGRRALSWPGRPDSLGDALPLRLAGGLHALVRRGRLPELARLYPPAPIPPAAALNREVARALQAEDVELAGWLQRAPQTNEVGRSALLMGGLLVAAAAHPLPMALFELGASGGLNLLLDRFSHRLGEATAGEPSSALHLQPDWEGGSPPRAPVQIVRRHGVDLQPLDVCNAEHRERLAAYVWPDQLVRLAQLEAALRIAASAPPALDAGDAAQWAETTLPPDPEPRLLRVITHTVAFQYFPSATRARLTAHIERVGGRATDAGPFAWLRFEADSAFDHAMTLRLTLWPGGAERALAIGQAHGRWVRWLV